MWGEGASEESTSILNFKHFVCKTSAFFGIDFMSNIKCTGKSKQNLS